MASAPIGVNVDLSCALGSGKYGTVFRGISNGTPVAIKVVGLSATFTQKLSSDESEALRKECEQMKKCQHENIVQYMGHTNVNIRGQIYPGLVIALMDTDLRKYLQFQPCNLPPHKEIKIAHDIAKALSYLHVKREIVHGDLHTGNVLLKCITANEGPLAKLCDFGLAKAISNVSEEFGERLSRTYRSRVDHDSAYESCSVHVLVLEPPTGPISVQAQEIRNFGSIMWEIHSRRTPDLGSKGDDNLGAIDQRPLHDVVRQCWKEQPSATDLTKTLSILQNKYPPFDPCEKLQDTIRSQQDLIVSLKKDHDKQIEDQRQHIKDLRKQIEDLRKQIEQLTAS